MPDWRLKMYRGRWAAVRTRNGATERVSLRTADREAGERAYADFLASQQRSEETVAAMMEAYLTDKDTTASDPARLRDAWKALKPEFGPLRPDQIDRQKTRDYAAKRGRQGRQAGTIARELSTLRAGLRWGGHDISAVIEIPSAPPPKDRSLTRAEYRKLLEASRQSAPHVNLFIVLALATAARAKALLELTWDRVDFERQLIRLGELEGSKRRATVPMTKDALLSLQTAHEASTCEHVIEYGGKELQSIRLAFKRACKRAGLDDVTPHVLRHTAAVWMAEAGVKMDEIAQYLGHSSPSVTYRVYARYSPDYLRKAASALEFGSDEPTNGVLEGAK